MSGFQRWLRQLFGRAPSEPEPAPSTLGRGWFEALLEETHFVRRYPQFAGVLARMDPVATSTVPVMAVGLRRAGDPRSRILLLVNRAWCDAHPEYRAGVLLHEIHHVVLGHLTRPALHRVHHPKLMELAMELSADESIPEPLPDNGLSIEAFAQYGIARGQSTLERYRRLASAYESGRLRIQDHWFASMRDTHRPRCRGGASGLGDLIDAGSDGATERNWNRAHAGLGAPTSMREIERMKRAIAAHLAGERGGDDDPRSEGARVAKELERVVFDGGPYPELDWRRVLREAIPTRRRVRPDYLRPNRRFPNRVGEIPGRVRRPPKPSILVGIDTSGSMSGDALDRIAREIERLARHARVSIAECDAVVHRVYPMRRLGSFVGGGDTDFAPVFIEAQASRELEGVVYFTDGKGAMPELSPTLPVVWALTHTDPFYAPFGVVVRLPDV